MAILQYFQFRSESTEVGPNLLMQMPFFRQKTRWLPAGALYVCALSRCQDELCEKELGVKGVWGGYMLQIVYNLI